MFPSDHFSLPFSVFIICRPEAAVNGRPYHLYGSVFILFAIFSVLHKNKPYKLYDLSAYKLYGAEQKKTRSLQHFRRTVYFL
jgi:drug/metabolite transporter superfamily protein YnfA